jgi:hypothetical protein
MHDIVREATIDIDSQTAQTNDRQKVSKQTHEEFQTKQLSPLQESSLVLFTFSFFIYIYRSPIL